MRKLIVPFLIVASLGASSVAMAAATPTTTAGAIKSLDAKACTVTLDNKTMYQFAPKCDFSKLHVGEKVAVTWELQSGKYMASKIAAA